MTLFHQPERKRLLAGRNALPGGQHADPRLKSPHEPSILDKNIGFREN